MAEMQTVHDGQRIKQRLQYCVYYEGCTVLAVAVISSSIFVLNRERSHEYKY